MKFLLLLPLAIVCAIATASQPYQVLFVRSPCQEVAESAAETAQQKANELLEGSTVNISVLESSSSSVLDSLIEVLHAPPAQLAVLFAGCSNDTKSVAEIANSRLVNITLFTYAFPSLPSSNSALSRHFRLVPSGSYLALGIAAFIEEFEWSRAVIISEDLPVFAEIADALNESLVMANVSVTADVLPQDPTSVQFPRDNRIFVLNMSPAAARAVLCEAALQNLSHPGYVWVSHGWYQDQWWELLPSRGNCTDGDIEAILEGVVAVSHLPSDQLPSPGSVETNSLYADYVVDGVLAIAHAINRTGGFDIYELNSALEELDFVGESGSVSFSDRIRTPSLISIQQYRKDVNASLRRFSVAHTRPQSGDSSLAFLPGEGILSLWPSLEGAPPLDGTPLTQLNYQHVPLLAVCYTLATAGIVFALVCLCFNIVFRKRKLIRLSSPNLNYITIVGAIIFYFAIYPFFSVEGTSPVLLDVTCSLRLWLASLGYVICYMPINAKMWRVYHICRRPLQTAKKTSFLKDWHLMLIVLFFVVVDVIMLVTVTAIDRARYAIEIIPDKENSGSIVNEDGYSVSFVVGKCSSPTEPIWLGVIFGYKFVLQGIGCLLAFSIRKVKIKELNDSKEVSAILYTTFVIIAAFIVVTFIYGDYVNVDGGAYGFGVFTATTVVLTFIFIPKMYALYRDPTGEKVFQKPSDQLQVNGSNGAASQSRGTEGSNEDALEQGRSASFLRSNVGEVKFELRSDATNGVMMESASAATFTETMDLGDA